MLSCMHANSFLGHFDLISDSSAAYLAGIKCLGVGSVWRARVARRRARIEKAPPKAGPIARGQGGVCSYSARKAARPHRVRSWLGPWTDNPTPPRSTLHDAAGARTDRPIPERGASMSFSVRVYLQLPGGTKVRYIGERDLEERPVRGGRVIIEYEGKMQTFSVDMVVPDYWQQIGGVPTVTVIPIQGE
jgi:hypothetical protein